MEPLVIAGRAFQSRLIVGTGKYKDGAETQRAIEASGAEMVTVAVRRVNLDRTKESLLDFIDPQRYFLLPNTAGCYTADEAIRAARLGREVGLSDWVKIEVIGDQATLYPDVQATLEATRVLVKEGFTVLPYTSDDIVFAKRLIDAGAAAVMPLAAPIGSGMGLQNTATLRILRELITEVPLIVDAGVGSAAEAALAMEMGADAVLMNTAIAAAKNPVLMAEAMQHAVLAGRESFVAGRMPRKLYATASSPVEGVSRVSYQQPSHALPFPGHDELNFLPCGSSGLIAARSAPAMAWWTWTTPAVSRGCGPSPPAGLCSRRRSRSGQARASVRRADRADDTARAGSCRYRGSFLRRKCEIRAEAGAGAWCRVAGRGEYWFADCGVCAVEREVFGCRLRAGEKGAGAVHGGAAAGTGA